MGKGAILSGLLHLAVLLLAVFGLPWLYDNNEILQATQISVMSEAQLKELQSKVPPAQQTKQDEPKDQEIPAAPKAPDVAQPEPEPEPPPEPEPQQAAVPPPPPQPEPPPEPPQQAEQPPPPVQPEPPPEPPKQAVVPEPPPQPKPEPAPPPEPQVAEAQPKPVPTKKPNPPKKKDEPKKPEPKERSLKDIINGLAPKDNEKKKKPAQQQPAQQAALPTDEQYDGPPVSQSEKDAIAEQVARCWSVPLGMQGVSDMFVDIRAVFNPDGSVVSAEFADPGAVTSKGSDYHAFADSAKRAVLKCNRFKMPADKPYQAWKEITFTFNPREMGL